MMKKRLVRWLAFLAAAIFLFTGCGAKDFSMKEDMGIKVDGKWYPIFQDAAPLLSALGSDYELFAAPSCLYDGEDKEFAYAGCSVFTNPGNGGIDVWYIIRLTDDSLETARGIKVGDTKDAVVKAYGDKYYMESDYQMVYSISGKQGDLASPCMIIDFENDKVSCIEIYYPTNV